MLMLAVCLTALFSNAQVQTNGEISAKDNAGVRGVIRRNGNGLMIYDSTGYAYARLSYLQADSIASIGLDYLGVIMSNSSNLGFLSSIDTHTDSMAYLLSVIKTIDTNLYVNSILQLSRLGTIAVNSVALNTSQGTSSAPVTGPMVQGVATTSKPTYSNSTVNPLSLNTNGDLRVTGAVTLDSTTQRSTIKVSQLPTVSLDSTTTRTSIKVSQLPTVSLDSTTTRNTLKISQMPVVTIDSSTTRKYMTVAVDSSTTRSSIRIVGNVVSSLDSTTQRSAIKVTQIPTVSIDSTTTRSTIKISQMPAVTVDSTTASRIGVKLIQNPTITNDSSTLSRTTVKVTQLPTVSLDSTTTRSAIKVTQMPSVDSTTSSRIGVKLLQNPTISNDSTTLSRTTVKVTQLPTVSLDSTTTRSAVKVTQMPSVDSTTAGRRYVKVQAVEGTVTTSLDSNTQRSTLKVSQMPTITISGFGVGTNIYSQTKTSSVNSTEVITKTGAGRTDTLAAQASNGQWVNIITDKTGATITKDQRQHRRTYNAAFTVSAANSATDIVEIIGSSTKTVLVHRITISGTQTTGGLVPVYIIKRSSAASAGTSTNPTYVPRDANQVAATAAIKVYTANPTIGSSVGNIWLGLVPVTATTGSAPVTDIDFNLTGTPILLSGTSQTLCINLNGVTYSGNTFYITVEWSETGE